MFVDSHSIAFPEIKDDTFNINKEIKELEHNKKTVDIVEVFTYLDAGFVVMECTLENFSKKKIVYRASLGLSQGLPVHCIKNAKILINSNEILLNDKNINENIYDITLNNKFQKNKNYIVIKIPHSILDNVSSCKKKLQVFIPYRILENDSCEKWAVSDEIEPNGNHTRPANADVTSDMTKAQ